MQFKWSGGRTLARALRQLPAMVAADTLQAAVLAGAAIVRREASRRAPRPSVRRRPRTMRLALTMKVEVTEKDRAHVQVAVVTRSPYAHLVEYGHNIIGRGLGRKALRQQVKVKRAVGVRWKMRRRTKKDGTVVTRTVLKTKTRTSAPREYLRALRANLLHDRQAAGPKGRAAARPFLRPAFDETKEQVVQRMAEVAGKGIEEHWRRILEQKQAEVGA